MNRKEDTSTKYGLCLLFCAYYTKIKDVFFCVKSPLIFVHMMMYHKYKHVAGTLFIDWPETRIKIGLYVMKRKLQGICYTNSACSLWRKSSSRGYALILREMLYDIPYTLKIRAGLWKGD